MTQEKNKEKNELTQALVLLDSHAILHRAYHALPAFTSPSGEPTGALYGFSAMLLKIIRELKPDYIAACYDLPEPTFRHLAYEKYKAQRPKTEESLASQINRSKEILKAFDIPIYEQAGFEADDIIGTLVNKVKNEKNLKVIIASGDLDTLQLIKNDKVVVYTLRKGIQDTVVYNERLATERLEFEPKFLVDFKGLKGDPSDNIIGIPGIGEKTAKTLIQKFGNLESIYQKLKKDEKSFTKAGIKPRVVSLLKEHEDDAFFSKALAQIQKDVPINFSLQEASCKDFSRAEVEKFFKSLGFISLINRLPSGAAILISNSESRALAAPEIFKASEVNNAEFLASDPDFLWFVEPEERRLGVSVGDKKVIIFENRDIETNKDLLAKIFLKKEKHLAFDAKDITKRFNKFGITPDFALDFMIAAWLYDPGLINPTIQDAINTFSEDKESVNICNFGGGGLYDKIIALRKMKDSVLEKLRARNLAKVFYDIEMPLIPVLSRMEERGILFNIEYCKKLSKDYHEKIRGLKKKIWRLGGGEFNIDSPKQLSSVLFDRLNLKARGLRKTDHGARSTKFSELLKLKNEHPIVPLLIQYREFTKLTSTYLDALPLLLGEDERLHTSYRQAGTVTGRLSSASPNLQNIPIRTEFGRAIRRAFGAEKGFSLVACDYSQIELRAAAALSGDAKMKNAFEKGEDIHALTAAEIFNVKIGEVTAEMRRKAKIINFGILYGMGVRALQEGIGSSKEEAEIFYDEYFHDFEGVRSYIENIKGRARQNGYVETFFGRRRYLPEINSPNPMLQREAERMAINAPIQGTAADIVKLAMINVDNLIQKEWLGKIFLVLQIHDELLLEMKDDIIEKALPLIRNAMIKVADLGVPLEINIKKGKDWGQIE